MFRFALLRRRGAAGRGVRSVNVGGEPRGEADVGAADLGAAGSAGTAGTAPEVIDGVNTSGADGGLVEGADIGDAVVGPEEVVEVNFDLGGGVDGDVVIFVADDILVYDGAAHGRASIAAVDVDADGTGGGGVSGVLEVAGDVVADDLVVRHVVGRETEGRTNVGVKGDSTEAVAGEFVAKDDVAGDRARTGAVGKHAYPGAADLHPVGGGDVLGDGVMVHAVMGREGGRHCANRRMRGHDDTALERVVDEHVVDHQVVAALGGFVADW